MQPPFLGMNALCELVRQPCVTSLDAAERLWLASRNAIVSPSEDDSPPNLENILQMHAFWQTWRTSSARLNPVVRTPCFVAACALRMAALDAATGKADALGSTPAAHLVRPFVPPTSNAAALELVRQGERAWHAGAFEPWNALAYTVCFAQDEHVELDEAFLGTCAAFDAECAQRDVLKATLANAVPALPTPQSAAAAAAWATRLTTNASDDVFAIVREARAWAYLTPAADRGSAGAPTAKLAHRGVSPEGDPHTDICFLFLFDYAMRQLLDIDFLKLFFAHDYDSAGALAKVESLKKERLAKPPPLVVHSSARWYVLYRSSREPSVERVEVHSTSAGAALAWMEHVMQERGGRLFLGKRLDALYADVTTERVAQGGAMVAQTDEVVW